MFQIKIGETTAAQRSILVYLLKDSDGKTPVDGYVPVAGDITIVKGDGTQLESSSPADRWTAHGGVSGFYTYQFDDQEVDTAGTLSFQLSPSTSQTTTDVRRYTYEVIVVPEVQEVGLNAILQNMSRRILAYLTDDATDLVPQTGLNEINIPTLQLITPGGVLTAAGGWAEVGNGLYHYTNTAAESALLGFIALVVTKTGVRTFVKIVQIVAEESGVEDPPTEADEKFRIPIVDERFIRASYSKNPLTGKPKYAAVRPKRKIPEVPGPDQHPDYVADGSTIQELEIIFYPAPDAAYTLEYRYNRRPELLAEDKPFPQGTAAHAETILASCLAMAEMRAKSERGVEYERYQELLEQSKAINENMELSTADSIWPGDLATLDHQDIPGTATAPGFNFKNLQRDVGGFMGFGTDPNSWTHPQDRSVDKLIQSGYRRWIYPPIVPQFKMQQHEWSFLRPVTILDITIDSGGDMVQLFAPDNFAAILGDLTYSSSITGYNVIPVISESRLRKMLVSNTTLTGRPQFVAISAVVSNTLTYSAADVPTQTNTTRWEFLVYPNPDAAYTLEYQYLVDPFPLVEDNVVPFGAPIHAETILASCIAAAELERDGKQGPREAAFMERLAGSISFDTRAVSAERLGYNSDRSDLMHHGHYGSAHYCNLNSVTYNGVLFD